MINPNTRNSYNRASAATTTDGIDEKLMELQQELVKKANNKEAYDKIADQIFALR